MYTVLYIYQHLQIIIVVYTVWCIGKSYTDIENKIGMPTPRSLFTSVSYVLF